MRESLLKSLTKMIGGIIAVAGIAFCVWLFFVTRGRSPIEREYRAQGFEMVKGCNGGAANGARGQILTLQQRLEDFPDSTDTNIIIQIKNALAVAQEKHRVLSDDCARRGHCETYPWNTNWAVIKEALAASERLYH